MNPEPASDPMQIFIDQSQARHPNLSRCSALLRDAISAPDVSIRSQAALYLGCSGCRRGVRGLTKTVEQIEAWLVANQVPPKPEDPFEPNIGPPSLSGAPQGWGEGWAVISAARHLIGNIFVTLGMMDRAPSHAALDRFIRHGQHAWVRADALEGAAFESKHFDLDLVLSFVSAEANYWELLSALYALDCNYYSAAKPRQARMRLEPLLRHPHPHVRHYTISALKWNPGNRKLIEGMLDDPDEWVRSAAREALSEMESIETEGTMGE